MRLKLHWQILIALLLAAIAGSITGSNGSILGVRFLDIYEFIGTLFINALKMLIVPLIFSAIITGISNIGNQKGFGRLGLKTIAYYLTTSFIAIIVGLLLVNLIQPGEGMELPGELPMEQAAKVEDKDASDIVDVFLRMVPVNIVNAAAEGQMLGIIFFSLLFGFFMTRIREDLAEQQINFWQGVFAIMMKITELVMRFAPIGVFGLVAAVVAKTGLDQFGNVLVFFFTVLAALLIHLLIILPLILKFVGGVKPFRHYRAMAPALLTAFSTSSSSATLPVTLDCVENNARVSNRTTSFVLPLGATVNMDGTALYECVAAMFIAQAYGLELSFAVQFLVVFTALLTSIGVAGIPSASLVAIAVILGAVGLPLEGIGMLLITDRVLDMCRTAVNVFSDSCGAVVIGKLEGEEQILSDEIRPAA
jgi:DAACS family dicarboxylate/amino acid:cation (Na+ or H+) symporter